MVAHPYGLRIPTTRGLDRSDCKLTAVPVYLCTVLSSSGDS